MQTLQKVQGQEMPPLQMQKEILQETLQRQKSLRLQTPWLSCIQSCSNCLLQKQECQDQSSIQSGLQSAHQAIQSSSGQGSWWKQVQTLQMQRTQMSLP